MEQATKMGLHFDLFSILMTHFLTKFSMYEWVNFLRFLKKVLDPSSASFSILYFFFHQEMLPKMENFGNIYYFWSKFVPDSEQYEHVTFLGAYHDTFSLKCIRNNRRSSIMMMIRCNLSLNRGFCRSNDKTYLNLFLGQKVSSSNHQKVEDPEKGREAE